MAEQTNTRLPDLQPLMKIELIRDIVRLAFFTKTADVEQAAQQLAHLQQSHPAMAFTGSLILWAFAKLQHKAKDAIRGLIEAEQDMHPASPSAPHMIGKRKSDVGTG